MSRDGPLELVLEIAALLDDLAIPYAVGGSVASSLFGEPRATADVDVAVRVDVESGERLLGRVGDDFYIPISAARDAIRTGQSFNILSTDQSLKIDFFVLGDDLLDRRQLERRVQVPIPGTGQTLWVTSAEDQVLRKLDWYRRGGAVSDRQWRDVVGILLVRGDALDMAYLRGTARSLDLTALLDEALVDAAAAQ
jgi:hypothetical protein